MEQLFRSQNLRNENINRITNTQTFMTKRVNVNGEQYLLSVNIVNGENELILSDTQGKQIKQKLSNQDLYMFFKNVYFELPMLVNKLKLKYSVGNRCRNPTVYRSLLSHELPTSSRLSRSSKSSTGSQSSRSSKSSRGSQSSRSSKLSTDSRLSRSSQPSTDSRLSRSSKSSRGSQSSRSSQPSTSSRSSRSSKSSTGSQISRSSQPSTSSRSPRSSKSSRTSKSSKSSNRTFEDWPWGGN